MNWCMILYIFIIVYCSVVIAVKDDKTSTPTNTKSIPDLNYSPPQEEDIVEEVQNTSSKGKDEQHFKEKSRYTKMIERKKRDGTLYAYKEKISKKMKLYRTNLSPAKKAEIAQRDMARQRKTLAESSIARENKRKSVREAVKRLKARKVANAKGIKESPENALRKQGRRPYQP